MSRIIAKPVGNVLDRMLTRMFGGHTGSRALKTPVTLQLLGGFGPFKFKPGTA